MAGDSHAPAGGGGGGGGKLGGYVWIAVGALLAIIFVMHIADRYFFGPSYRTTNVQYGAPQQQGFVPLAGYGAAPQNYSAPQQSYGGGVPSPQDIFSRVPHRTSRVCVPCVQGYVQNPSTCECSSVTWRPGY